MNPDTERLLSLLLERLQRSIGERDCPAMVMLGGPRPLILTDYDYLRDDATAAAFEERAAARAREAGATRWVIAVPQVWVITAGAVSVRAVSNHPLRDGEQEAITWMAVDPADGVDYGRVPFARRPRGEPVFGDTEVIAVGASPAPGMPGYTMLRILTSGEI
jgi:hypothetical protein